MRCFRFHLQLQIGLLFNAFHTFKNTISETNKRYARWSLGFVNPPLEISGTGSRCKITALNARGQVLLEPVLESMNRLKDSGVLSKVSLDEDVIEVELVPPSEVGSFSEEERSRQVRNVFLQSL